LAFVARNTRQGIRITGRAERETIPEYPEDAVREAIVNAICHRDYAAVGTVQVRIYDDRLEVWNPGTLPPGLSIESLSREHPSRPRNPRLAQALYRARLIEHWGTGTLRMIQAAKDRDMKLEFGQDGGVFMVRFVKTAQVVSRPADVPISARQERVLRYLTEHGTITRREYRALVQVSERQSLRDLTEMMERGILVRSGKGRTTCYRIPTARLVRDSVISGVEPNGPDGAIMARLWRDSVRGKCGFRAGFVRDSLGEADGPTDRLRHPCRKRISLKTP
jgi:ATP-dependent DNA helicase RecG